MNKDQFTELSCDPDEGFIRIPLYNRWGWKVAETVFDFEDLERVQHYRWFLHINPRGSKSVVTWNKKQRRVINMSHIILDYPQSRDSQIDHKDGNPLNNRKSNLRPCTHAQNLSNRIPTGSTSKYKGVYWHKQARKWQVRLTAGSKSFYLGLFDDERNAARVYNVAAEKHFGEFARLNEV